MAAERIIGVDFGTSTSVIRIKRYENGEPLGERLEVKEVLFGASAATVPTLVQRRDEDGTLVYFGYEAQQRRKKYTLCQGFKMDLESSDPQQRALARQLTAEFYDFLARQYKNQSDGGHLGSMDDREKTIVSYPVKWQEETKAFMLACAREAGFPNVTGTDEAQAAIQAAIVMSADHLRSQGLLKDGVSANILLIDMGAGTTDLVLVRHVPGTGNTQVLNTWPKGNGIPFGGQEIDRLLQNFFRQYLSEEDADTIFRRVGPDKFKIWKEETVSPTLRNKEAVTDFDALDSCVELLEIDMPEYKLDRNAFENCIGDYLRQFPLLIQGCLEDAGMDGSQIDLVIITGGHSQWYFVKEMLAGNMPQFGQIPLSRIRKNPGRILSIPRPQETVSLGLAYSGIREALPEKPHQEETPSQPQQPSQEPSVMPTPPVNPLREEPSVPRQNPDLQKALEYAGSNALEFLRGTARVASDAIQQAAEIKRQQDLQAAARAAQARNINPKDIPYTPETEFELGSHGEDFVIRKYIGTRTVVSIPPFIRGRRVVEIAPCAFGGMTLVQGNKTIEMVVIPGTVRRIGHRAFAGCFSLHTVITHMGIERIGESAFWGCNNLQLLDFGMGAPRPGFVVFPRGLQFIGALAFLKAMSINNGCILKEVHLYRGTKVQNSLSGKTFDPKSCAVFYYD